MSDRKTRACMLLAASLIVVAGPALAKSQQKPGLTTSETYPSERECNRFTPPFMYNPRFMNRGFFKPAACRRRKK